MSRALIGYTGFVGSNIMQQASFDEFYNSKNIQDIKGKSFDLVVCAGVPAVKWWANQNPDEDLEIITELIETLRSLNAKQFVLISTVDVYPSPAGVIEDTNIELNAVSPYGKHRLFLERELQNNFKSIHIIRLPGLFGKGLKKNILFDMICGNILEKINLESSFQWYPLSRIWQDIQIAIKHDLNLVNLAVEPVESCEIKDRFFSNLTVGSDPFPKVKYDMHTEFAKQFGSAVDGYMMSSEQVLDEMAIWLKKPEVKCG